MSDYKVVYLIVERGVERTDRHFGELRELRSSAETEA